MSVISDLQTVGSVIGLQVEAVVAAGTDRAIENAFAGLAQRKVEALMVSPSPLFYALRVKLAACPHALEESARLGGPEVNPQLKDLTPQRLGQEVAH
jgi:hypothetical protein